MEKGGVPSTTIDLVNLRVSQIKRNRDDVTRRWENCRTDVLHLRLTKHI